MVQRLNVVLDGLDGPPSALRRSAEELTGALIAQAPDGCEVAAIIASSPEPVYAHIVERLPGLASLEKSALARRELAASWRGGFARVHGMTHAVNLLAPLAAHDRLNGSAQLTVTVHDAIAWTHPELLDSGRAGWTRAMGRRAERYADAVVVPSHAVAAEL
ncbi:glycosyltransferase family 4 protein, partial [Schumannella luteola]